MGLEGLVIAGYWYRKGDFLRGSVNFTCPQISSGAHVGFARGLIETGWYNGTYQR